MKYIQNSLLAVTASTNSLRISRNVFLLGGIENCLCAMHEGASDLVFKPIKTYFKYTLKSFCGSEFNETLLKRVLKIYCNIVLNRFKYRKKKPAKKYFKNIFQTPVFNLFFKK